MFIILYKYSEKSVDRTDVLYFPLRLLLWSPKPLKNGIFLENFSTNVIYV